MPHHAFINGKTQGGDATITDANEWNAAHTPITSTCAAVHTPGTAVPLTVTVGASSQVLYVERCDITCDGDNDADVATVANGSVVGQSIDLVCDSVSGSTTNTLTISATFTGGSGTTSYTLPWSGAALVGAGMKIVWDGAGWVICQVYDECPNDAIDFYVPLTTDPPAKAGMLQFYAKNIGGRTMPKWMGPSGVDTPFQPFLGFNKIICASPAASGTTVTTHFAAFPPGCITNAGTATNIAMGTGATVKAKARWAGIASGTTAGNMGTCITPNFEANIQSGFFFSVRFGAGGTIVSGQRQFHGLWASTTAATNVDPTAAATTARIGIAYNLTGTAGNLLIVAGTGSLAFAAVDLGATSFAVNNSNIFEFVMFCAPGASSISYRVTNLETNAQVTGTISGNIPAASTLLAVQNWVTNNATAAAATMLLNKWYLESDY
jgi:hypothetical protein